MSATVVHCKRAPYDIYIGRGRDPASGAPSEWGNPYSHRPSSVPGVIVVSTVDEANRAGRRATPTRGSSGSHKQDRAQNA